jgi:hypothetical protein
MMGYWTPNIDRFAKDRAVFTDWYGQHKLMATRDHMSAKPLPGQSQHNEFAAHLIMIA